MAASAVRRRRSALAAGVATLAMTLSLSTPAQAAPFNEYVALGDSYAAGVGAGAYVDIACGRSANAYSELADDLRTVRDVTNVACGGKTTQDVVSEQLGVLDRQTDLVTITAGGNNLGFGNIVGSCGALALGAVPDALIPTYSQACDLAKAYAEVQLSGPLYKDLVSMIRSVHAAAPNAKIVVTGYPYLFDPIDPGRTDALAEFIYQATDLANSLNATIEAAAGAAGAGGRVDVDYVDVRAAFAGHGVLAQTPWINLGGPVEESFHPNAVGYQAYFGALSATGAYSAP